MYKAHLYYNITYTTPLKNNSEIDINLVCHTIVEHIVQICQL